MQISFATSAPDATLALPVEKDALERLATGELGADALRVVIAAARASRFDGEAAAVIDVTPLYKYLVKGPDAGRLLDRVITRDVSRLQIDQVMLP